MFNEDFYYEARTWNLMIVTKNAWVRKKTVVIQQESGIVVTEGYSQFERIIFVLKFYFRFRLLQLI